MIYLDSCVLIYLNEALPNIRRSVAEAVREQRTKTFCVSPLTRLECLVVPLHDNNTRLIGRYRRLFGKLTVLDMSPDVYEDATRLRAQHALKTPDALHLATAMHHGCEEIWTNDLRLDKALPGITFRILP